MAGELFLIGGKKELHGDSVDFFCGKNVVHGGEVFLTAEKTLCTAVRGNFPAGKNALTLRTGVFDGGKNVVHGGEGGIFPREKSPHLVDRCF